MASGLVDVLAARFVGHAGNRAGRDGGAFASVRVGSVYFVATRETAWVASNNTAARNGGAFSVVEVVTRLDPVSTGVNNGIFRNNRAMRGGALFLGHDLQSPNVTGSSIYPTAALTQLVVQGERCSRWCTLLLVTVTLYTLLASELNCPTTPLVSCCPLVL